MMNEEYFFESKRGKWSQPGVPHKDWICVDIEDLGEPIQICEMCESQHIRYVHFMQNAEYDRILQVGCVCAGHMESDLIHAKKRDDFMKSRANKRKKWISRKWKISRNGNEYIVADGYVITVFFKYGKWKALVKSEDEQFEKWSRKDYSSINAVKLASFDYVTKLLSEIEK